MESALKVCPEIKTVLELVLFLRMEVGIVRKLSKKNKEKEPRTEVLIKNIFLLFLFDAAGKWRFEELSNFFEQVVYTSSDHDSLVFL